MAELAVIQTRGGREESLHRVACAVVQADRGLVAHAGDPVRFAWWRSAAKPFQAMPLIDDGGADRFGLGSEELALTCASHSSEPEHLAVVDRFLGRIGATESDLLCGPHPPLSSVVQRDLPPDRAVADSAMEQLLRQAHRDAGACAAPWLADRRLHRGGASRSSSGCSVGRQWTGVPAPTWQLGVDGCTTVCYGLPLDAMARAWARFGTSNAPLPRRLREAMLAHPFLVAGTGRPCTQMMETWPGQVIAKIGADGVYGAALPELGLGVAIKVEDGDMRASALVMVAVIRELFLRAGRVESADLENRLSGLVSPPIRNTRGEQTGHHAVIGALVFSELGAANG